jgi:hypothetical protein
MRKPAKRKNGLYEFQQFDGIVEIADKVVEELCEKYPNIDILDIEIMFEKNLSASFTMANLEENAVYM